MNVLETAIATENMVHLPEQVSPNEWKTFSYAMNVAGGVWSQSQQSFVFERNAKLLIQRLKELGTRALNKYSLYETPREITDVIMEWSLKEFYPTNKTIRILEPSIGGGALVEPVLARIKELYPNHEVELVGYDIDPINVLLHCNKSYTVSQQDFLKVEPTADFDIVIQNPPFNHREYIKHLKHGQKFLHEAGLMIGVAPTTHVKGLLKDFNSAHPDDVWLYHEASKINYDFINEPFDKRAFKNACIETSVFMLCHPDYAIHDETYKHNKLCAQLTLESLSELDSKYLHGALNKWRSFTKDPNEEAQAEFLQKFIGAVFQTLDSNVAIEVEHYLNPTESMKSEICRIMGHEDQWPSIVNTAPDGQILMAI